MGMCRFCLIEGQCLTVYELYHVTFSVNIIITSALCINKKCLQPHHIECTSSCLITEVKQYWAELVLRWVTAWEYSVLQAKTIFPSNESILTFILHMVQSVNTRKLSCWYSFIFAKYQFSAACLFCTPRVDGTI